MWLETTFYSVLYLKPLNCAEFSKGEEDNSHFEFIICFLGNLCKKHCFNFSILNGGVAFVKVDYVFTKSESSFGRGLEILTTWSYSTIINAHLFIIIVVEKVSAR